MKPIRVLVLVDAAYVPPESTEGLTEKDVAAFKTEQDVVVGIKKLGHEARVLGVASELGPIRELIQDWKPHVVFNLLEEFRGQGVYVPYFLGYLELIRQSYTGCNPGGMLLTHNKGLSKKILKHHRIRVPDFAVFVRGRKMKRPSHLTFPLIVKSLTEHGSVGISQDSIVRDDDKLMERVQKLHQQLGTDAIVEQFIDGRELYVGVMGNARLTTLPIWELEFTNLAEGAPRIATEKVKWDANYQARSGVKTGPAVDIPDALEKQIVRVCKRTYKILGQTGYARIDLRLTSDGRFYVLESNPNPQLADGEDFAASARAAGLSYGQLLQRIVNLGIRCESIWQG